MPGIQIVDRNHSPPWGEAARLPHRPLLGVGTFVARALFRISRFTCALRDRIAAAFGRLPDRSQTAGSTWLAYGSVVIMAAILVKDLLAPGPANSSVAPVPQRRPDWQEIARAQPSFALEAQSLAGLEAQFVALRHRTGGGRKDMMSFGRPDAGGPYVRVSLYRPGDEGMAEPDALEAVVELAARSGIHADLQATSGKVRTKFGDLPAVNMRVRGKDGWRNCVAVNGAWNDPRLGLVAWWCNPDPAIVALGEFACFLDRIALMSAGGDDRLAEFFARAELRRNYCPGHSSFVSPTPRLTNDWIDARQAPRLRGHLSQH